ncbi:ribonuclease R [Zavarzinia sp. CC-PAN008]|uniref:ribonuclease R n=1 Tax=Zavarzinia sp. CC-PAN008 TaxID=3243332 RepID=UPI003F7428F7
MAKRVVPLPSKGEILKFVELSAAKVGKREIARAFHITGDQRIELKRLLAEMAEEGLIGGDRRRSVQAAGQLPAVAVLEVVDVDVDGELTARPAMWDPDRPVPRIVVAPGRHAGPAPGPTDRILCRLERVEPEAEDAPASYVARVIRTLSTDLDRVLGVIELDGSEARLKPTDKRAKYDYVLASEDLGGAQPGELVLAEVLKSRAFGPKRARVRERLGRVDSARAISLIAIHGHGIPTAFPTAALEEAAAAQPVLLGDRVDLRAIPLITIDPSDARDHDDAVFAEADGEGWHVIVAIADVAHYVRPGSALDQAARDRGNSAYFPDRVVPMLPHELSSTLCSLLPGEDRACLALHLWLDAHGTKLRHRFERALMRSAANLSYERAQSALDGNPDEEAAALLEPVLKPLHGAWSALMRARAERSPLDIDAPEKVIVLGEDGTVVDVRPRARLDTHRIVEEMMIAANVAAAESLEATHQPCMYRVHDTPSRERVESVREFLATLDLKLARGSRLQPAQFNRILERAAGTPHARVVHEVILRAQAQAAYSPENIGHFGLNLARYAHFTSPIRRYADLLVHRALIRGLKLGEGGLSPHEDEGFAETAQHISNTERRAMAAERESTDRYLAAFMADRLGAIFSGRITGVARFGLFVALDESGADGLIPISHLGDEYFTHVEHAHALVGERTGTTYRLGDAVRVRLEEATPLTGGLRFSLFEGGAYDQTSQKMRDTRKKGVAPRRAPSRGGRSRRR